MTSSDSGCIDLLPSDLTELIIAELHDSLQDLSSCSLVCRDWLSFARSHTTIFLTVRKISGFLELMRSPEATLFSTIRRLDIWVPDTEPQVLLPILEILPEFTRLRSLSMWCNFPDGLPPLPRLTELDLLGKFGTYAHFLGFMSNLTALRKLTLTKIQWGDFPEPPLTLPSLELEELSLDWAPNPPSECIMFPLHTPRLILSFWPGPSPEWLQSISRYLHRLGDHLRYLQLNCESNEQISRVSRLDFSHSTGLKQLRVGEAVRLNVLPTSSDIAVSPELERLLASVTPHCRLETLILGVQTENIINPTPWPPLSQFAELMDARQFATVREIQFIVNGSPFCLKGSARQAREHFESLLPAIVPSHPTRRVVCIDGEDPDEVWC
ncbi:hypothetical protein B0H19DRAFT_1061779 [Mycena capillaripes]|nr:hypothetical protein B0H19DRAFT_1061779 [Mycena capillaripes]